jgi:hypothetical protein
MTKVGFMTFIAAGAVSLSLFNLLMAGVLHFSFKVISKVSGYRKWLVGYVFILFSYIVLTTSGLVSLYFIPIAPIMIIFTVMFCILFSFSSFAKELCSITTIKVLVGIQVFRLPLELILHKWGQSGTIPVEMTWSGQNLDVFAGIITLLALPVLGKNLKITWCVQLISFLLLLNVIRVAMFSSPFPFSWPLDNPLQVIMHFPYALIVPVFVGIALIFHLLAFRKLLS